MNRGFLSKLLFSIRVEGESGWPRLVAGKRYFATALGRPKRGDMVVFPDPQSQSVMPRLFVKEVKEQYGSYYKVGSATGWGSSSDDFGLIHEQNIWGRILGVPEQG